MNTLAAPSAPSTPYRRPGAGLNGGSSYSVSSFDLHAGLDVRVLAVAQVPADVLRELQRSRSCWLAGGGAGVAYRSA